MVARGSWNMTATDVGGGAGSTCRRGIRRSQFLAVEIQFWICYWSRRLHCYINFVWEINFWPSKSRWSSPKEDLSTTLLKVRVHSENSEFRIESWVCSRMTWGGYSDIHITLIRLFDKPSSNHPYWQFQVLFWKYFFIENQGIFSTMSKLRWTEARKFLTT